MVIQRMTFFKLLDKSQAPAMLSLYETLSKSANKNGKPYILSMTAKPTIPNTPGDQGYSFVAISQFKDMEDLLFYDKECEAHKALKASLDGKVEKPPLSIWVEL